nr:unnamed protein product [Callosobruchus chinensis]
MKLKLLAERSEAKFLNAVLESERYHLTRSEPKRALKKKCLSIDAQEICLNVYNGLLSSMQYSSKGSVLKKASQLTNVPYKTLYKIIRNGVKTRKKRSNFGKFKNLNPTTAAKIRNIVYDCYKKRQIPTAEIAHRTLLEKGGNSSRRTLQRWLRKIGFRFGTIDKKDAIMESRQADADAESGSGSGSGSGSVASRWPPAVQQIEMARVRSTLPADMHRIYIYRWWKKPVD